MLCSYLFEIDETSPVNIPYKQKHFMIPGPVWVRPLSGWQHENEAFQDQNFSLKNYPHHPLYHIPLPKSPKILICGAKVIGVPEAPEDLH